MTRLRVVCSTLLLAIVAGTAPIESANAFKDVPEPAPRILGGTSESAAKAPWIVKLVTVNTKKPVVPGKKYESYGCSGTVIAPTWILTAAHCVFGDGTDSIYPYPATSVRVFAPGVAGQMQTFFSKGKRVARIYSHPLYLRTNGAYNADIALLKLAAPLPGAKAMALDDGSTDLSVGAELRAYGWGVTDRAGERDAESINAAWLTVQGRPSDATCGVWDIQYGSWSPSFLCSTGGSDQAVCSGDSGGPFAKLSATGVPTLVGVTSYGSSSDYCGTSEAPTVGTRVAPVRWWIDAVMKRSNSIVATTASGSWTFVTDHFGFDNGAIEQKSTGHVYAIGWPEPTDSIINVARLNGATGARMNVSTRNKEARVWWQDTENDNWVNDAAALRDGRVVWGVSYIGYDYDFPTLNVSSLSSPSRYRDWAGEELAEKVLGDGWVNGWNWLSPRITPTASGGVAAAWWLYGNADSTEDTVVAVFRSDGSLDPSFGTGGWVRLDYTGGPSGLGHLTPVGSGYVLAGQIGSECAAVKLLGNGTIDSTWGAGGVTRFRSPGTNDGASTCRVADLIDDGAGGVYVIGTDNYLETGVGARAFVTRLDANGSINTPFASDGWYILDTPANDEYIGVCKSTTGKLVIGGVASASALRGFGTDRIGAMAALTILTANGDLAAQMRGRSHFEFNLGGERDRFVAATCLSRGGAVLVGRTTVAGESIEEAGLHSVYIKINVK